MTVYHVSFLLMLSAILKLIVKNSEELILLSQKHLSESEAAECAVGLTMSPVIRVATLRSSNITIVEEQSCYTTGTLPPTFRDC